MCVYWFFSSVIIYEVQLIILPVKVLHSVQTDRLSEVTETTLAYENIGISFLLLVWQSHSSWPKPLMRATNIHVEISNDCLRFDRRIYALRRQNKSMHHVCYPTHVDLIFLFSGSDISPTSSVFGNQNTFTKYSEASNIFQSTHESSILKWSSNMCLTFGNSGGMYNNYVLLGKRTQCLIAFSIFLIFPCKNDTVLFVNDAFISKQYE